MNKKEKYNNIPVYYCKNCKSLKIMRDGDSSVCGACSTSHIGKTSIEQWTASYKEYYGENYVDKQG